MTEGVTVPAGGRRMCHMELPDDSLYVRRVWDGYTEAPFDFGMTTADVVMKPAGRTAEKEARVQ